VCQWAFPLGLGDDPPVIRIADGHASSAHEAVEASPTFTHFVEAMEWDEALWAIQDEIPVIQAQAAALSNAELGYVASLLRTGPTTRGWPTRHAFRFESLGQRVALWSDDASCDWWATADTNAALAELVRNLLACPTFREAAWSNSSIGERVIAEAKSGPLPQRDIKDSPPDGPTLQHLAQLRTRPVEPVASVERPDLDEWAEFTEDNPALIVGYDDIVCHSLSATVDESVGLLLRLPGVWSAHREDCETVYLYGNPSASAVVTSLDGFWSDRYLRLGLSYVDCER
jgi:hypothetical protein